MIMDDNRDYSIGEEIISYRIALSLTGDNSFMLTNNAEEYYRQMTDALSDITNDTSSSYLYFAFISLASATLEYSLNLMIAWFCFDKYNYPECNRYIKKYMLEYKRRSFKDKLFFVPSLVSDGVYVLNDNNKYVKSLEKMISIRNSLLHNKEKIQVFTSPDLGGKVMDGEVWISIENAKFSFQITTEDNIIKALTKEVCVEIGMAMLEFKRQILNPVLACRNLLGGNMIFRMSEDAI